MRVGGLGEPGADGGQAQYAAGGVDRGVGGCSVIPRVRDDGCFVGW